MAREKPPEDPVDDIPAWVMTFSDVITLLMTFFILLLTFASSEKESFERMQVAVFGGGGSRGIAGEISTTMDKDSVLMRERQRSGRISNRGSEMPSTYTDPEYESLSKGIAGLTEEEDRTLSTTHRISLPIAMLADSSGNLTDFGKQQLRAVATQMKRLPLRLDLIVADAAAASTAIGMASFLTDEEAIGLGRTGVTIDSDSTQSDRIQFSVTQEEGMEVILGPQ